MTAVRRPRHLLVPVSVVAALILLPVAWPQNTVGGPSANTVASFSSARARPGQDRIEALAHRAAVRLAQAAATGPAAASPAASPSAVRRSPRAASRSRVRRPNPPSRTNAFAPGWQQRWGAQALALITYPWRDLGWQISFHPARRGVLALAFRNGRRITVFVRANQSIPHLAFTVAHEIGHAVDFTHGSSDRRAQWKRLRGIDPDLRWTGCRGCSDLATPAGDFAEVFATWQVGPVDYRSQLAKRPTAGEMRTLSSLFGPA
ncbi:MAG TPA: hypothetical protein VNB94_04455 [Mycobacteriales bacterium]|nr:hypothetical protein [Mycobacteriales bacterium]